MKIRILICLLVNLLFFASLAYSSSDSECVHKNDIKIVTYWNKMLCIVSQLEDTNEVNIFKVSNDRLDKIYSGKFDGVYKVDSTISEYFLIIYGASTVSNIISLLKWDKEKQLVSSFSDDRFDGDSRLRPAIIMKSNGFQLITFGNVHDTGWEHDKSKWFAHIYNFKRDILKSVQKVPFNKQFNFSLE